MSINREQAALLFIDYQKGLMPLIQRHEGIISVAQKLATLCDVLQIPALVSEQMPEKLGGTVDELTDSFAAFTKLSKCTFSCLADEGMNSFLSKWNRKQIILAGMETHICIYLTARDLLHRGFEVVVVSDGVSGRIIEHHDTALAQLRTMGAMVIPFETLAYDLMGKAGTAEFKQLLPLFK